MPNHSFSGFRNVYIIHFIKSGKGSLLLNNQKYELCENDAFLIRPNQLAIYTADSHNPWEYCYFAFSGESSELILENTLFAGGAVCIKNVNPDLYEYVLSITDKFKSSEYSLFSAFSCFLKLFDFVHSVSNASDNKTIVNGFDNTLKRYIDQNYYKNLTVNSLASEFGYSRTHLLRLFKNKTGLSIEQYIIVARITNGKRLIENTELGLCEIASLVGYDNYSAFFKAFKKEIGISPLKYRQQYKSYPLNKQ